MHSEREVGELERAPSASVSLPDGLFPHDDAMLRRTMLRSSLLAALTLLFAAPLPGNAQQKKAPPAQHDKADTQGERR